MTTDQQIPQQLAVPEDLHQTELRNSVETKAGGTGGGGSGAAGGGGGSTVTMSYGKREIKTYPINESELNSLFLIGVFATICLSICTGLFGFAIDISKDLSFTPSLPEEIKSTWNNAMLISFILSAVAGVVGVVLIVIGGNTIKRIKKDTLFF